MPEPLTEEERGRLARHARATWGVFIAFWIAALLVILAYEFLAVGEATIRILLWGLGGGVALGVLLQFSQACPRCGANLGRQVRLGIPSHCQSCGVGIRRD